ncbi:hypothetical protein [Paenarthrobacter sp. PH39-S1]|uniref:hypothetical protein n=1 Tax=Paenarthrobacter sp. PH39-S1 TaxID=3046204 RepID=UPI0024B9118A|nr:hypothetical protein [Paenarthrobacter sp. PH39-S1]MDJ0356396.1 hypothetical protein [Paenarthrobacter sp. PH39-S1]
MATHRRGTRRNSFVTDPAHAPAGYEDTSLLWTRAYFLRQAAKVGPYTVEASTRLLDRLKIEAQGYRACMNILGLGKGNNRSLLEQACRALCTQEVQRPISYTVIKLFKRAKTMYNKRSKLVHGRDEDFPYALAYDYWKDAVQYAITAWRRVLESGSLREHKDSANRGTEVLINGVSQ